MVMDSALVKAQMREKDSEMLLGRLSAQVTELQSQLKSLLDLETVPE
jgi:hypothetical protein